MPSTSGIRRIKLGKLSDKRQFSPARVKSLGYRLVSWFLGSWLTAVTNSPNDHVSMMSKDVEVEPTHPGNYECSSRAIPCECPQGALLPRLWTTLNA